MALQNGVSRFLDPESLQPKIKGQSPGVSAPAEESIPTDNLDVNGSLELVGSHNIVADLVGALGALNMNFGQCGVHHKLLVGFCCFGA